MKMKNMSVSLVSPSFHTQHTLASFLSPTHPPTHTLSLSLSLSLYLFSPSAPDAALQATPPAARREAVPPGR